ncbi:hypothetical protein OROHE_026523 [Orobanche hederae]
MSDGENQSSYVKLKNDQADKHLRKTSSLESSISPLM